MGDLLSKQNKISKQILNKMFKEKFDFIREDLPNKDYLEANLTYLDRMAIQYKNQSEDLTATPTSRSSARDLLQNCIGLSNGIKFSLSFLDHKDVNLFEYQEPGEK